MREILFRGKRLNDEENEWAYGSYVKQYDCDMIYFPTAESDGFDYAHIIPETVGQYTGLTDKNGKKIFEGDIVKICLLDGVEIGQIIYSEMSFRFKFADKYGSTYGFDNTCTFEVIGNIHDNPELLKGGGSDAR